MTVEEALEGEKGRQYVWNLAAAEGGVWKPPERIAGIVQDLLGMDEKSLSIVRGTIGGIAEGKTLCGSGGPDPPPATIIPYSVFKAYRGL
jgi:hypothetical protein